PCASVSDECKAPRTKVPGRRFRPWVTLSQYRVVAMTSVQAGEHEREQRDQLAGVIERRQDEILRRWLDTVKAQVEQKAVRLTNLRNAMPDYLAALTRALRGEEGSVQQSGKAAWSGVAREHGLTRAKMGFDIEQLVREFIVLRQILFDVARE